MANSPAAMKQVELTRYAKAMRAAGIPKWRVEVEPTGKHIIIVGDTDPDEGGNPCDRLLK